MNLKINIGVGGFYAREFIRITPSNIFGKITVNNVNMNPPASKLNRRFGQVFSAFKTRTVNYRNYLR